MRCHIHAVLVVLMAVLKAFLPLMHRLRLSSTMSSMRSCMSLVCILWASACRHLSRRRIKRQLRLLLRRRWRPRTTRSSCSRRRSSSACGLDPRRGKLFLVRPMEAKAMSTLRWHHTARRDLFGSVGGREPEGLGPGVFPPHPLLAFSLSVNVGPLSR